MTLAFYSYALTSVTQLSLRGPKQTKEGKAMASAVPFVVETPRAPAEEHGGLPIQTPVLFREHTVTGSVKPESLETVTKE